MYLWIFFGGGPPSASGPARPRDNQQSGRRRRSPLSPCSFPNCAEMTNKLRDHVTRPHLHPVFRRSVLLGDEAMGMRLRVYKWLADQLLGSWATLMDMIQSVPTFQVFLYHVNNIYNMFQKFKVFSIC